MDINKPGEYATAFEAFIAQHPMTTAIGLAFLIGLAAASFARPFLHGRPWKPHAIRLIDFGAAFGVACRMWPGENRVIWALFVGLASPTAYWLLASLLCWKWPALKQYLSLRELIPDDDETGDDTRAPTEGSKP